MTTTLSQPKTGILRSINNEEYFLGISTDTLVTFYDPETLNEVIIEGDDTEVYIIMTTDLDTYLQAISVFKQMLLDGKNPVPYILKYWQ